MVCVFLQEGAVNLEGVLSNFWNVVAWEGSKLLCGVCELKCG